MNNPGYMIFWRVGYFTEHGRIQRFKKWESRYETKVTKRCCVLSLVVNYV